MKNNKGDTLVEVLVSIVILGIICLAVSQLLLSIKKSQRAVETTDNITMELEKIMEIFTNSPTSFSKNLQLFYSEENIYWSSNKYYIYYDSIFNLSTSNDKNYFIIEISNDENLYTIDVTIYKNSKKYQLNEIAQRRTVKV